jgi:hypothetical protein
MVDASTFALAAAIVLGVPTLGGGISRSPIFGALRRSWASTRARPHLAIGTLASCLIPLSFPALVSLAYKISCPATALQCAAGGETYSALEVVLAAGVFAGSLAVSRANSIGSMRVVGLGLFITGGLSIVIAINSNPFLIAVALLLASIGNPIYQVANQTALVEAADPSTRGSIMSTRFGLVQTASVIGTALGGVITKEYGPSAAYAVLGVGLVVLAMYAIAAGRSTINPLHGAAYEEAALQAKT